jgi:hypothetical protein
MQDNNKAKLTSAQKTEQKYRQDAIKDQARNIESRYVEVLIYLSKLFISGSFKFY